MAEELPPDSPRSGTFLRRSASNRLSRAFSRLSGSPSSSNLAPRQARAAVVEPPRVERRASFDDGPATPSPRARTMSSVPATGLLPLSLPPAPFATPRVPSPMASPAPVPRLAFGPSSSLSALEPVVAHRSGRASPALGPPGLNARRDGTTVAFSTAVAGGVGSELDGAGLRGTHSSWGKLTSISKWGGGSPGPRSGKEREDWFASDAESAPLPSDGAISVDDEACFVDSGWEGKVDFIVSLPHEISLYILLHLPLHALIASTRVSRNWRQLALDNLVWRDLFHRESRWRVREDLGETTSAIKRGSLSGAATPSRAGRRSTNTSGNEGISGNRLGKRLSDIISDLGGLSLTPMTTERRRHLSNPAALASPDESSTEESEANTSTATPRRPASGITTAPFVLAAAAESLSRNASFAALTSLDSSVAVSGSTTSTPGPSRRASSAALPPLGPVPSPSLGWTPAAPLFLDWPKLYRDRFVLEQRWETGQPKSRTLKGHTDSVYCLQFDQSKVITGSRDKTIRVWDTQTGKCLKTLLGHSASVLCLQYDSKVLISGSSDCRILVWDLVGEEGTGVGKWEVKMRLLGHTMGVLDLCFDDQWIVSCSKDTTIRVWHKETGELYRTLSGHRGPVNAVQLLNNKIVSASGDSFMKLWDVLTGEVIRVYSGHERGLACVQYSPSGKIIASGSNDKLIKIWDAETGECLRTLAGHTDLVRTLAFDETRRRLVSGSYDKTLRSWDLDTGEALFTFNAHSSLVFDVSFSASKILSHDQKIVVLDFGTGLDVSKFMSVPRSVPAPPRFSICAALLRQSPAPPTVLLEMNVDWAALRQLAATEIYLLDPPGWYLPQLTALSSLLGVSLLLGLVSVFLRVRQGTFWLFRRTETSDGQRYLEPHSIHPFLLISIASLCAAQHFAQIAREITYYGSDLHNLLLYRTYLWPVLWLGGYTVAWAQYIASLELEDRLRKRPSARLVNSIFLSLPLVFGAVLVPLITLSNLHLNLAVEGAHTLDGLLAAAVETAAAGKPVDVFSIEAVQVGLGVQARVAIVYWSWVWVTFTSALVVSTTIFAFSWGRYARSLSNSMTVLRLQRAAGSTFLSHFRAVKVEYRSMFATAITFTLFHVLYIGLGLWVAIKTYDIVLNLNVAVYASLVSLYIYAVIGLLAHAVILLRSIDWNYVNADKRSSRQTSTVSINFQGRKSLTGDFDPSAIHRALEEGKLRYPSQRYSSHDVELQGSKEDQRPFA